MKSKFLFRTLAIATGVIFSLALSRTSTFAQSTAFTYQGRLNEGANLANGIYDLRFAIYDALTAGTQQGGLVTNSDTAVSNGLFTVTMDFGNQFPGANRWLEIAVRTNGAGSFFTLTPRQQLTPTPYAIYAANAGSAATATSAGSVSATNIGGALNAAQLPAGALIAFTNAGTPYLSLGRVLNGTIGGLTNLLIAKSSFGSMNQFRFNDTAGSEQVFLHAKKNMDVETENDNTFWVGHDYTATVDHDFTFHVKHDETVTVDNNLTETVHANFSLSVDNNVSITTGNSLGLLAPGGVGVGTTTPQGLLEIQGGADSGGNGDLRSLALAYRFGGYRHWLRTRHNAGAATGNAIDFFVNTGSTATDSTSPGINNVLGLTVEAGNGGSVGIGTPSPQANLHVYSANNPTVVRVQSTGTPGFGRLEFVSNPQGDFNEWRPGYIQSTDAGGFTGGLAFFVNGSGAGSKFGSSEVMRLQNGRVGIGTNAPTTLLQVGNATCNGTTWANASDRNAKEGFRPVDAVAVLAKVAALPLSEWSYKVDSDTRHIGPMAQDFYAAFNVGPDDKHIATVDADGVALAAIQGLNQKFEQQRAENAELKQQVAELKQLVQTLARAH